jgi:uncharacterized membrane protein YkvI
VKDSLFARWLLPGFLFQSVLVGGGYATGRELVEFFLSYGPRGGLMGILLATLAFSVIAVVFFEFARVTRSHTYMDLFRQLLGRGWFLFEIGYFLLGVLVLAVVGAAAGEIAKNSFGLAAIVGTLLLCVSIIVLVFYGTGLIERVLAGWSLLLYAVYGVFITLYLLEFGDGLASALEVGAVQDGWVIGTLEYVGYNIVILPAILFVVQHFQSSRDSVVAGTLAGPIAMLPALFFYLAMASDYESILQVAVPSDYMINKLGVGWLSVIFYITIFGTFIETGTAFIHAINERLAETVEQKGRRFEHWHRSALALVFLVVSVFLADALGLVNLIGQGYGTLTWFFIVIFLLPLMTLGLSRVIRESRTGH